MSGKRGGKRKTKSTRNEVSESKEKETTLNTLDIYDTKNIQSHNPHNIIEITTCQSSPFKTLIETLNGLLSDASIQFTKQGIYIREMDYPHSKIFMNLELYADNFEQFYCREDIIIGVKLGRLNQIIKTVGANNILTLFMDENDNNTKLGISISNKDKNIKTNYKINLLDRNYESLDPIMEEYPCIISMSATYFQKICRDAGGLATKMNITRPKDCLFIIFEFDGEHTDQETIVGEAKDYLTFVKNDLSNEVINGNYELEQLITFAKCTSISTNVKIHLSNKHPLMVEYQVGNLGIIQLTLNPLNQNI